MPSLDAILTIGVYGMSERQFFDCIVASRTDCFVDVRQRRGLRGSEYAFANSVRLQEGLATRNINYVHLKQLAPTEAVRRAQKAADSIAGVGKRDRAELGEAFRRSYCETCLVRWAVPEFVAALPRDTRRPMLFCVERLPSACHRSLVAAWVAQELSIPVEHYGV